MIALVVYLGLMPALLFSAGEGIRLIPFPETSPRSGEVPAQHYENGTGYQENATRIFCDGFSKKSPKKQQPPEGCTGSASRPHAQRPDAGTIASFWAFHPATINISDREPSGFSGRAPPLV